MALHPLLPNFRNSPVFLQLEFLSCDVCGPHGTQTSSSHASHPELLSLNPHPQCSRRRACDTYRRAHGQCLACSIRRCSNCASWHQQLQQFHTRAVFPSFCIASFTSHHKVCNSSPVPSPTNVTFWREIRRKPRSRQQRQLPCRTLFHGPIAQSICV